MLVMVSEVVPNLIQQGTLSALRCCVAYYRGHTWGAVLLDAGDVVELLSHHLLVSVFQQVPQHIHRAEQQLPAGISVSQA